MTKMTFRNHQYNVIQVGNMFIAITSYGGKRVRAVAKCAPGDTFDADLGAQLAMARFAQKVEKVRLRNLRGHKATWTDVVAMATKELTEVTQKYNASIQETDAIGEAIEHILNKAR